MSAVRHISLNYSEVSFVVVEKPSLESEIALAKICFPSEENKEVVESRSIVFVISEKTRSDFVKLVNYVAEKEREEFFTLLYNCLLVKYRELAQRLHAEPRVVFSRDLESVEYVGGKIFYISFKDLKKLFIEYFLFDRLFARRVVLKVRDA